MTVTVVIPVYNEEKNILEIKRQLFEIFKKMPELSFKILFVDDGSVDKTRQLIKELAEESSQIEYLSFTRNFGKEAALIAGLEHSEGEYVAVMDADLQDPPALLLQMILRLFEGEYDCVAARRVTRKGEPMMRSMFARLFYVLINKISKIPIVDGARDFRLMTRQMVDAICSLPEYNRFSKGLFQWVGFKTYWIPYENVERYSGSSKWSFWSLLLYSFDGIVAFSTTPLAISSVLGVFISLIAFCMGLFFVWLKLFVGISVEGYATLIVVILMLGGLQLLCIGILGQYLSKTYLEVKGRPKYVIKEKSFNRNEY